MALSVDSTKVYIPYLAYELSLKSDRLHKGAVIPNFQRKDILNLITHTDYHKTEEKETYLC